MSNVKLLTTYSLPFYNIVDGSDNKLFSGSNVIEFLLEVTKTKDRAQCDEIASYMLRKNIIKTFTGTLKH